jgi:O-antigen ligase
VIRAKVPEVQVTDDWVTSMPGYLLNRNAAALALCLWPMLLMTTRSFPKSKPLFFGMAALAAVTVMVSDHETSKLALAGGAVAFAVSRFSLSAGRALLIAGWTAATMLVVPLSALAYSQQMYQASWLPETARHRVIIWSYVAEQVARAPILGVGVNSTRPLSAKALEDAEVAPGSKYLRITTSHSHNVYLQAWYETGAVGATMLFAWGLLVIASLKAAPAGARPFAYATFATAALVAGSSFSLWAMWLMAAFALAALLTVVGILLAERSDKAAAGTWPPLTLSEGTSA